MAEWWPFDRSRTEEWKRNLTEFLAMSSAAAASLGLPQPRTLTGDPFALVVGAARARLVGKTRTFPFSGRDLTMTLSDISVDGADLAKVVGQYGTVRVYALDVQWDPYHLERLEIRARNMHLRPGTRPTLVAAPVLCEAFISASFASRWLASVSPRLQVVLRAGVPQIEVTGLPWLRLEMETGAEGRSLRLRPRAVHVFDRRVSLPAPTFVTSLPDLPDGFMLTSVAPAPGGFLVRGLLSDWQQALSRDTVERLLAGMRGGTGPIDI